MATNGVPAGQTPLGIVTNHPIYITDSGEQRTICTSPTIPPAMSRTSTWRVEDFELHKELYRGKTSLLYMATDRKSGIQVALKLYRKRKLSTLNRYQVEREIRIHINLNHENIIKLFAAFEDEKNVYMVQEFAGGGDLFEDLKKNGGQLKEKQAVRDVVMPFLSALSYLHSMGIIHRDIKPENILLTSSKVIKIADFGLSIDVNQERPVTRAGTLDYMAPEVLICPDKRRPEENKDKVLLAYTAQVDSWAVGILAYELLVGYPPFEQESRAATYEHIMYKEPKFPAWMSEDARKFITVALCKNATARPTINDLTKHSWIQHYAQRQGSLDTTTMQPSRLSKSGTGGRSSHLDDQVVSALTNPPPNKRPSISVPHPSSSPPVTSPKAVNIKGSLLYASSASASAATAKVPWPETANGTSPGRGEHYDSISDPACRADSPAISPTTSTVLKADNNQGAYVRSHSSSLAQPGARAQQPLTPLMLDADASYSEAELRSLGGSPQEPPSPSHGRPSSCKSRTLAAAKTSTSGIRPFPPGSPFGPNGEVPLAVERSGSSYIRPQSGVLSDDSVLPNRTNSMTGVSRPGPAASPPARAPAIMERPALDRLAELNLQEGAEASKSSSAATNNSGGSKYAKLFAKMWGGSGGPASPSASGDSFRVQPSSPSGSGRSGIFPRNSGRLKGLPEDLAVTSRENSLGLGSSLPITKLREDSILSVGPRQDSLSMPLGMNSVEFKQPTKGFSQRQQQVAACAVNQGPAGGRVAAVQEEDFNPINRMHSESVLVRPMAGAGGRSFTTKQPGMKKIAQGAIVSKIEQYVQSHHQPNEQYIRAGSSINEG